MDNEIRLIEQITKNPDAMAILFNAILTDTIFIRALMDKISESVGDGCRLVASESLRKL